MASNVSGTIKNGSKINFFHDYGFLSGCIVEIILFSLVYLFLLGSLWLLRNKVKPKQKLNRHD
jgi:hypothetical protein